MQWYIDRFFFIDVTLKFEDLLTFSRDFNIFQVYQYFTIHGWYFFIKIWTIFMNIYTTLFKIRRYQRSL